MVDDHYGLQKMERRRMSERKEVWAAKVNNVSWGFSSQLCFSFFFLLPLFFSFFFSFICVISGFGSGSDLIRV